MAKKTIEHAANALKKIMAGINKDVIKDYEMPKLGNIETCSDTGFAVILTLNTKYYYTNKVLDMWRDKLQADYYTISACGGQLRVRFFVMYQEL